MVNQQLPNNGESGAVAEWSGLGMVHAHVAAQSLRLLRVSGGQSLPGKFLNFAQSEVHAFYGHFRGMYTYMYLAVECICNLLLNDRFGKIVEQSW